MAYSYQFADGTQRQESEGLRYPAVQDEPNRFGTGFIYGEGINKFELYIFNESAPYKPYKPNNRPLWIGYSSFKNEIKYLKHQTTRSC